VKVGIVSLRTLKAAKRWDAAYNIAIAEYLKANDLPETPANVEIATQAIKDQDIALSTEAKKLRIKAAALIAEIIDPKTKRMKP
jgi:hypothetical protein